MTTATEAPPPAVKAYLRRVRSHLPLGQAGDILMELESTILDRVEDLALEEDRDPDSELVERALEELGEPEAVAGSYVEARYLIGPDALSPFLFYTALLFVLHLVLIGVATSMERPLGLGLIEIAPSAAGGFFGVLGSVLHALLLDIGAMVVVFAALPLLRSRMGNRRTTFAVEAGPRHALGRAGLSLVVGVLLNYFREDLLVVAVGNVAYPLFTPHFEAVLPLLTFVLACAMVKDVLYVAYGENRTTLAVDAVHGVIGVGVLLYMLAQGSMLALPRADVFLHFHTPVNAFLEQIGNLVLVVGALLLATKTIRRLVRFAQI